MLDACTAATGEEPCDRPGGVKFDQFIAQLMRHGEAPSWRFSPERLKLDAGGTMSAPNRGGEFHTFSRGIRGWLRAGLQCAPRSDARGIPGIFFTAGAPPGGVVTTGPTGGGHAPVHVPHPPVDEVDGRGRLR